MSKKILIVLGVIVLIVIGVVLLPKSKEKIQTPSSENVPTSENVSTQTPSSESMLESTPTPPAPSETQTTQEPTSTPTSESQVSQGKIFEIQVSNSKFNIDKITVKAGESVSLKVSNKDSIQYVFGWRESQLQQVPTAVGAVPAQKEVTFSFTAPQEKGEYCFIIEYPFNLADRNNCTGSVLKVIVK